MRFVILGAGAIGGVIAAGLHNAGHRATLIARGDVLKALTTRGLLLQTPDEDRVLAVEAVGSPVEADIRPDDVVIVATKSQDTAPALDALAACQRDAIIVSAQNGLANETAALRRFERVYGVAVWMPARHVEPGVIQSYSAPVHGSLPVGRFPSGVDDVAEHLAEAFADAGCMSVVSPDIMRLKRAKLLLNLMNVIALVHGDGDESRRLHAGAVEEALACYAAAGWDVASPEELAALDAAVSPMRPVHGSAHAGSSALQSVQRGTSLETDFLNGEIALLGRLHGVPTPINARAQREIGLWLDRQRRV